MFEGVTLQRLTANPPEAKFQFMLSFANFDLHKGHANGYWAVSKSDHNDDDDQTVGSKDEDKAFLERKFCAFAVVSNPVEKFRVY